MNLQHIPLLAIQRDLYRLPRGMERFQAYLNTMANRDRTDLDLPPLVAMNPMAREHVPALLDEYLAIGAEELAAEAVQEATGQVVHREGEFRIGLVVSDDLHGGWTNRHACEYGLRFPDQRTSRSNWLSAVLWSSEPASPRRVREAILTAIYRSAYLHEHGRARTLRERMAQEGEVMARAGCTEPQLDVEDLEYSREVIAEFLDCEDMRTTIECLWGDEASRSLGFTPRGLTAGAGLAVALHDARGRVGVGP